MIERSLIRTAVRDYYDAQKLRIQTGNRIAAAFRWKLGLEPSQAEEDDAKAAKVLDELRKEYKRITDGITKITTRIKIDSPLISSYGELMLIEAYEQKLRIEATYLKYIEYELDNHPIYTEFLKKVRGIGPLMAGVIISEIDINKAKTVSALYAYAGVDVVYWFECKEKFSDDAPDRLYRRHPDGYETRGPERVGLDKDYFELIKDGVLIGTYGLPPAGTEGLGEGRSKKSYHLVPKEYTNAKGEVKLTKGITFNPFLKTKLVGVMGSPLVFLKKDNPYRAVYDEHKAMLEQHPKHADKTKLHRHNMAVRHIVKEFLWELYVAWRSIENLPIRARYWDEKGNN
jgi:Transposase IS116/IS110/IS902 family